MLMGGLLVSARLLQCGRTGVHSSATALHNSPHSCRLVAAWTSCTSCFRLCLLINSVLALSSLQTQTFMNKSNESHLRLLALEHMGSITGRLRRDAMVTTDEDNEIIIDVISQV